MKKKIFKNLQFLILCLIITSCQKQHSYHIIGNLQGIPDSTIIDLSIQYEIIGIPIATDTIMNGIFSFSDSIGNEILRMSLRMRDMQNYSGECNLWVSNSDIKVSGNTKYLSQWKVSSNVKEQNEENNLLNQTRSLRIAVDSLRLLRMHRSQNNTAKQEISSKIDSINYLMNNKNLTYLQANYNSLISVIKLNQIAQFGDSSQKEIIRGVYSKIDTIYSNTLWGEGIKNLLNKVIPPSIGERFIDFSAKDLQGRSHKLSDYTGKYILLDFGMMACYACMLAAPETRTLSETYQNELNVISINLDTRKEFWEKATKRDSITWINLSDGKGTFGGIFSIYGIDVFPTYILIDPQGIIVERWMGYDNGIFNKKLSKYFEIKN
jgi:peroxiredoxin